MAGFQMWARHIFFQTVKNMISYRYLYYEIVLFSCLPAFYVLTIYCYGGFILFDGMTM